MGFPVALLAASFIFVFISAMAPYLWEGVNWDARRILSQLEF